MYLLVGHGESIGRWKTGLLGILAVLALTPPGTVPVAVHQMAPRFTVKYSSVSISFTVATVMSASHIRGFDFRAPNIFATPYAHCLCNEGLYLHMSDRRSCNCFSSQR